MKIPKFCAVLKVWEWILDQDLHEYLTQSYSFGCQLKPKPEVWNLFQLLFFTQSYNNGIKKEAEVKTLKLIKVQHYKHENFMKFSTHWLKRERERKETHVKDF